MSIFDAYNAEYASLSQEINKNLGELKNMSKGHEKSGSLIKLIDGLFSQATDLIKQMEVEVRSQDPATRKMLNEKVMQYKKSNQSLRIDFDRAREQVNRSALIGDRSGADRQRLMDTNDKISRQNDMIANATRTVAETEEIGMEITTELQRNREKIDSSREKAQEFGSITDGARRLISSMSARDTRQKWMIWGLALFLVVMIVIIVYFTQAKKKK